MEINNIRHKYEHVLPPVIGFWIEGVEYNVLCSRSSIYNNTFVKTLFTFKRFPVVGFDLYNVTNMDIQTFEIL